MTLLKKSIAFIFLLLVMINCSKRDVDVLNAPKLNEKQYFQVDNKKFNANADNSISYFKDNKFQYFASVDDLDFTKNQKVNAKGEDSYEIVNNKTNEKITLTNLRYDGNFTIFDAINSNGSEIKNIKFYNNSFSKTSKLCPWCPVAELIVTIVAVVVQLTADSGSSAQAQCTTAMNALHCGGGSNPYMNFSDGWFSTTCSVGCR